jgi:hypothetical protein
MSGRPRIAWFDIAQDPENLTPDRAILKSELAARGCQLSFYCHWDAALLQSDLLVLGDTVPVESLRPDQKVLGLRTLNRRTRLDVLAKAGLPVQPYATPRNDADFQTVLRDWGIEKAIVKLDWSFRRAGVVALSRLPLGFDPACDVVMKPVTGGDSRTLKVDLFAGHVLGASWLDTRPIGQPNWQMIGPRRQWQATLSAYDEALWVKASRALLPHGVGAASIDVMIGPDGPVIIEANTTNVSTAFWRDVPRPYADRLSQALVECLHRVDNLPPISGLAEQARKGGNDYEAILPDQTPGDFHLPDDICAELDTMMREADALSESERVALGERVEADLLRHAKVTVPAYLPDPDALRRVVSASEYHRRSLDFIARRWPDQHGMVTHALATDLQNGQAGLQTRFAAAVEASLHRRALRWAGVANPGQEVTLIDFACAGQDGLGRDTPAEEILNSLAGKGPVSLWTTADTACRLADALNGAHAAKVDIRGIVLAGPPLVPTERRRISFATGARVAEVLYLPPAGTLAIRCPVLGLYHVLSDVGRVEAVLGAAVRPGVYPLVMTGFYNFAQPMINVQTGLHGSLALSPPPCSCPVSETPMIGLSDGV